MTEQQRQEAAKLAEELRKSIKEAGPVAKFMTQVRPHLELAERTAAYLEAVATE